MTTTGNPSQRVSVGTTSSGYLAARPLPPKPPRRSGRLFLGALVLAVVAAAIGGLVATIATDEPQPTIIRETVAAPAPAADPTQAPEAVPVPVEVEAPTPTSGRVVDPAVVGAAVIPSIVTIQVGTGGGEFIAQGSGSGVVIDEAGYVVTNDHVAGDASEVRVVFPDGTVFNGELVGTDPVTDLAVVRVETADLVPIEFGSSDALTVGDAAIAVGSPLGLEGGPSLSVGVISAVGREVQTDADSFLYGMLQTDAPITSGSSGGALVDGSGALIGITTAVGVSNIGVEGIGGHRFRHAGGGRRARRLRDHCYG
jgi:S1-C subfamily serine protease